MNSKFSRTATKYEKLKEIFKNEAHLQNTVSLAEEFLSKAKEIYTERWITNLRNQNSNTVVTTFNGEVSYEYDTDPVGLALLIVEEDLKTLRKNKEVISTTEADDEQRFVTVSRDDLISTNPPAHKLPPIFSQVEGFSPEEMESLLGDLTWNTDQTPQI